MRTLLLASSALLAVTPFTAIAQRGGGGANNGQNPPLASLKSVSPPTPGGLDRYVRDPQSLIALGKVLFWDMQAGSDGRTACATCHFHAGADHRLQNQLSGRDAIVNRTLTAQDFPFRVFANAGNNRTALDRDNRQITGSMGVVSKAFVDIESGNDVDVSGVSSASTTFTPNGFHLRQVTGRNSPSVINAVFNVRNFWDGRASSVFNGASPFGGSDGGLHAVTLRAGQLQREPVRIENASLASQAVGPVLNSVEMSWAGRSWPQVGRKLLSLAPLSRQVVSPADSVLGDMANPDGNGLRSQWSYRALIQAAFHPEYHSAPGSLEGFTQMENNFALFWGLAIQAYEATLIADDSRVDQALEGRTGALTPLEQQGLNEFRAGGSQCLNCHNGAETTAAGWTNVLRRAAAPGNGGGPGDLGFFRIGVTPIGDDIGFGGSDEFGQPLFAGLPAAAAAGTFKAPSLRNVELTGPYFHDGSQATLDQVLQFYARNGDFPAGGNLGPGIGNVRLNPGERNAIVAFLKALTDDRVRFQRAPFDHPSICVPNGHVEFATGQFSTDPLQQGLVALDKWALVPAVGREGTRVPLQTFDELLNGIGNDGSRANTMTTGCQP